MSNVEKLEKYEYKQSYSNLAQIFKKRSLVHGYSLLKEAIHKGNTEFARIHAENAIHHKNQAINFLRMSAKVDAMVARVQTAVTMGKTARIFALMDRFEHHVETLDVQAQQMEDRMSSTTTLTTPENQVDVLLQEMADEAGLDLNMELPQGQTSSVSINVASIEQDELPQSLACLLDQV